MTSILEICPWGEETPPRLAAVMLVFAAVVVVVVVCSISFFLMAQKKSETILFPPLIHSGGKEWTKKNSVAKYESVVFHQIIRGQGVLAKIHNPELRESAHHYPAAAVEECGNCNLLQRRRRRKNEGTNEASERASEATAAPFLLFFRRCCRRRRGGRRRRQRRRQLRRDDRFWQSVSETTISSSPLPQAELAHSTLKSLALFHLNG